MVTFRLYCNNTLSTSADHAVAVLISPNAGIGTGKDTGKDDLVARVDAVSVHAASCVDGRERKRGSSGS